MNEIIFFFNGRSQPKFFFFFSFLVLQIFFLSKWFGSSYTFICVSIVVALSFSLAIQKIQKVAHSHTENKHPFEIVEQELQILE